MIAKTPTTLAEFYHDRFEPEYLAGQLPKSKADRLNGIKRFAEFIGREPLASDLTAYNLVQFSVWLKDRQYTTSTARGMVCNLRGLWRAAFAQGLSINEPPAAHTAHRPKEYRPRKPRSKRLFTPFKLPNGPPPILTPDSPLIDVFWHFAYRRLEGKHPKTAEHYRGATHRLANCLGRTPMVADLTDANLESFAEWGATAGYSTYTIDNTRWMLRALWHHAHQEGIKADIPCGPRRPVNDPPAPFVEDISSALAIHRASIEREQKQEAQQHESPRQVLASVGDAFKRLFSPPSQPPPPTTAMVPAPDRDPETLTIAEIVAAWRASAGKGLSPGELANMNCAVRPLEIFSGRELAAKFGPKKLKAVRDMMVNGYEANGKKFRALCRRGVNAQIGRIKRIFKWAVSEELVPASLFHGLDSVAGLRQGRTTAFELPPIMPVDYALVEATLPHLSPPVAAMVQLQYLAAMRPGEVCIMRPCDVDRSADVWEYRPHAHKGQWCGRERVIFIGPLAQEILRPYLERDPQSYCFSPREATLWRRARQRKERATAVQPSQIDRSVVAPKKRPGSVYRRDAYTKAISRTCRLNGLPAWHPNQLRHAMATKVRKEFGLESAQVILGHSRADVTQIYAERNGTLATEVIRKIG